MSGELVGPLPLIRFADDTVQAYDVPRNTIDARWAACRDHHPACDCREAHLAEDIGEWRAMFRAAEQAILEAIKGHQTYAHAGIRDSGLIGDDEFGQCKCQACVIARAAHIGRVECMQQARDAHEKARAEADEQDRAYYARMSPLTDEVPF